MLSQARAHPQPRMPRQMHFSLLQKLNFKSCGLIFLIQKQRSNRKYVCLVYLGRTLAIRLSKSISKFCISTFNPSERCCALPFQRPPCSGAGLAVSGAKSQESGTAPASLAQPQQGHFHQERGHSELRCRAFSEDVSSLELFTYFLLYY